MKVTAKTWETSAALSEKFRVRMGLGVGSKRHIDHLVIALAEEVGEISSLIKKAWVRGHDYPLDEILYELTDVQQYIIAMFETCAKNTGQTMDDFVLSKCAIVTARLNEGDGTSGSDLAKQKEQTP